MTVFPFQPTQQAPFQFQPTLDGQTYNAIITWNLFGRFYLNLYSLSNVLVVCEALVGSPVGINIQSLTWLQGNAILTCSLPHGFKPGSTATLTVQNCAPASYNGVFSMLAVSDTVLSYSIATALDPASQLGSVTSDINLIQGYGFTSTLVYRTASQQFEVSP